jgi:hypothetical protein
MLTDNFVEAYINCTGRLIRKDYLL